MQCVTSAWPMQSTQSQCAFVTAPLTMSASLRDPSRLMSQCCRQASLITAQAQAAEALLLGARAWADAGAPLQACFTLNLPRIVAGGQLRWSAEHRRRRARGRWEWHDARSTHCNTCRKGPDTLSRRHVPRELFDKLRIAAAGDAARAVGARTCEAAGPGSPGRSGLRRPRRHLVDHW